jgi:hypothetical protein
MDRCRASARSFSPTEPGRINEQLSGLPVPVAGTSRDMHRSPPEEMAVVTCEGSDPVQRPSPLLVPPPPLRVGPGPRPEGVDLDQGLLEEATRCERRGVPIDEGVVLVGQRARPWMPIPVGTWWEHKGEKRWRMTTDAERRASRSEPVSSRCRRSAFSLQQYPAYRPTRHHRRCRRPSPKKN